MEKSARALTLGPGERDILRHVFINMPWSYLPRYIDNVLDEGMNIELGFGAEELDEVGADAVAATVGRLRGGGCRITAHGPFWDLCPGSTDPEIRKVSWSRIERFFAILESVRPERIVCHTGFDPRHHNGRQSRYIDNSVEFWTHFVKAAEKLEAPLVLENVWEEDPQVHREILESVESPWIGFCLDTGHQHAFSRTSLGRWLDATADRLKEIHLHDNDGSHDHHLSIGRGNIDFDYLFGFLNERGLRPVLTLEPHAEDHLYQSLYALSRMESFAKIL